MSIATDTSISKRIIANFSSGNISLRERSLIKNRVTLITTVGTNTDTALNAVVSPYRKGEIDGSLIMFDDIQVYADAEAVISKEDQILIGVDIFRIENIKEYNPAGTVLGYVLQCRK
tara:strand:- start:2075 stop:2425 length:351 start_codon:yes stop_codon:yes gene_type:complete